MSVHSNSSTFVVAKPQFKKISRIRLRYITYVHFLLYYRRHPFFEKRLWLAYALLHFYATVYYFCIKTRKSKGDKLCG